MDEKNASNGSLGEPPEDVQRWTAKRRAALAMSILKGETTAAEAARAAIRRFKANPQNAYVRAERDLNLLGYELMGQKKLDLAVGVFKLNVEVYPDSFNVYDSLAEAYLIRGDRELAIKNYQTSLELNPKNFGAAAALATLKAGK
jgi:tetratricopeptide (TPR) repeat protein